MRIDWSGLDIHVSCTVQNIFKEPSSWVIWIAMTVFSMCLFYLDYAVYLLQMLFLMR